MKFSLLSIRVGAEASPSRMHVEISLPEGGQLFRVKINQKSHFAAAMGAVELLLDLQSVLCPSDCSQALLRVALGWEGQKIRGALSGLCALWEGDGEPPWRCVGTVGVPEVLWGLWFFFY